MKLNMGENIRKYRRGMELTQEQLADKLGTSVQSVSRWECGATYPDMEMLPAIADAFQVTVNDLFYCGEEERKKFCDDLYSQLEKVAEESDAEKATSVLKDIRRSFAQYHDYYIWGLYHIIYKNRLEENKAVVEQLRGLTGDIIRFCPCGDHAAAIEWMAQIEDDDHIQAFLDEYSSEEDISRTRLLLSRYRSRRDFEKHESIRKPHLIELLYEVLDVPANWRTFGLEDPAYAVWCLKNNLAYLHSICDCTPDPKHPLTGNGELDLFCDMRLDIGWILTWALAGEGKIEEASTVMEDLVSLLEKITAIKTDTFTLSATSPALRDFTTDAWFEWVDADNGMQYRNFYWKINGRCWAVIPNEYPLVFQKYYAQLHSDLRFNGYMQRVNACVVTRTKAEQ